MSTKMLLLFDVFEFIPNPPPGEELIVTEDDIMMTSEDGTYLVTD